MIEQQAMLNDPAQQAIAEISIPERRDWIVGEPAIDDMLRDPVLHSVLRRDGLSQQDLLAAIDCGRRRLTAHRAALASSAA